MNITVLGKYLLLFFLITGMVQQCHARTPEQFRSYRKQQVWDKATGEIHTHLYKNYTERNNKVTEKWVCIQPNENRYGYLYVIYTTGRITKQYQTDNYSYYEGLKCDKRYDDYPNFSSTKQAVQFYKK